MTSQLSNGHAAPASPSSSSSSSSSPPSSSSLPTSSTSSNSGAGLVSLAELPKSSVFTDKLPGDAEFPTPGDSHGASRDRLGPRIVRSALYTFVRPEEKAEAVLAGVSARAMRDLGIAAGDERSDTFRQTMAGNRIFWDADKAEHNNKEDDGSGAAAAAGSAAGVYPWAQCYGGWQFGSWAGQLGDGRAISLFETRNGRTGKRYEVQLKGAGRTPYSRFADGRAVVRSSVREFLVSEALHGLAIPTTRALALTLTPKTLVRRERMESGAIVCRFAESWLRIGSFDIQRARGERKIIRRLADYVAEEVYGGWNKLPSAPFPDSEKKRNKTPQVPGTSNEEVQQQAAEQTKASELHLNRYAALYRAICIANAKTVAAWQAYGFTNGVLNTDNTSLLGLSLDFGPFAFIDNFDPTFTPNHDDHALRYCYRNQPSVIWWNLVRLGESLGELLGAGPLIDDPTLIEHGVKEEQEQELIGRAEDIIMAAGEEYQHEFLAEYKRLMTRRLGLKTQKESDFNELFSEALDCLQEFELDFTHFFRRLGNIPLPQISTEEQCRDKAAVFFHAEGMSAVGQTEAGARERLGKWLAVYRSRAVEDWGETAEADDERRAGMRAVNPKFIPRGWLLDEIIAKVQDEHDFETLRLALSMVEDPFREEWGGDRALEERWCGEVPRTGRGIMCSCSS